MPDIVLKYLIPYVTSTDMKILSQINHYFKETIWEKSHRPSHSTVRAFFRITISSIKGFVNDECFAKASALTYYSLLSIIPLFAIGFGIGQLLGFEENLKQEINKAFQEQPVIAEKLIEFASASLKQTEGGLIASLGLIVFLWTVFSVITSIETFFNKIWHTKASRSFLKQTMRYIPLILLLPIFVVITNSSIIYLSSLEILKSAHFPLYEWIGPATHLFFRIIPYTLAWMVFTFLYLFIPNAKVSRKAGLIAGLIASIAFETWQWIYINFQLEAASYGVIYGSFAAVPLFLIWLNNSWLIILFGTEVSYNIQKESKERN